MRRIILSFAACLALSCFSTLSHIRNDFWKESYCRQNVRLDFLYKFHLKCFSFYEEFSAMLSLMHTGIRVKYSLFLSYFNETWIFSTDFRQQNGPISNLIIILPVRAEWFHADRRTDGNEGANSRFSQRCEAPEKVHASVLYSKSTEPKRGEGRGYSKCAATTTTIKSGEALP